MVFHPLGSEQIRHIATLQTRQLAQRLAERGIGIRFSDAALDLLAEAGFDPVYGARPLRRAVQMRVENPLARAILDNAFVSGDTIAVEARDGELSFERAP